MAERPARYLGCVISRFVPVGTTRVDVPAVAPGERMAGVGSGPAGRAGAAGQPRGRLDAAHDRQEPPDAGAARRASCGSSRRRSAKRRTRTSRSRRSTTTCRAGTARPSSPSSTSRCRRRRSRGATTPSSFDSIYPHFFLAHEVAHQWWGQAVGWKNYHEQWLSEGLAQYFAALYADTDRGPGTLAACSSADARHGVRPARTGPDLARLPARSHPVGRPRLPRASSTTSPRSCSTCCAG